MSLFTQTDAKQFQQGLSLFAGLMKQEGITVEQAILKKTYVQICSLSTEQSNFSYKDLAALLNIPESDIEEWAIEAIANKIIDAKIDQMNK